MGLSFPWPASQGEWLAWCCAAITTLVGLLFLFAPRTGLRLIGLQAVPARRGALAGSRATIAGFYLGLGLSCILLAQPLLYMALGFGWAFTAFGRLVSMLSDKGVTLYNICAFVVEIVLVGLPLAFAFGFLP
jgi:hypothetical protein